MKKSGFTLIELIVFIVIISIAASILFPILLSLRFSGTLPDQTVAQQLARSRMELILEQRIVLGFGGLSDPCSGASPPTICTPPTGYTISAVIANNWSGDTHYQIITVQVSGKAQATLTNLVANYE